MFARKTFVLAFAGAALAGCGASTVPSASALSGANPGMIVRSLMLPAATTTPKIKHVTPIKAQQTQKIVIKGTGFGTMQPYDGDSCCIEIVVTNPECEDYGSYDQWNAGYESSNPNLVTLKVKKWSNKQIVITGFTGDYGQGCWTLNSGQPIQVNVWNAQTQAGPASWNGTIK